MTGLLKKWWFWLIIILLVAVIIFFLIPIKACLVAGPPTYSTAVYETYFNYIMKGCPLG
ncbi:MAG TPA: hypothetical protein VMC80_01660 [Patescibacteria group bacterium]|nr:hypothetical protein [Patescibacteria group bacterium]